jgi:hypothetical protein
MASLALQTAMTEWPARIIRTRMLGVEQARDGGVVVTAEASIGALRAIG